MNIEQMFEDAGFTNEYIKSRKEYIVKYRFSDKVTHVIENTEYSGDASLPLIIDEADETTAPTIKDESKPSFDWDEDDE